MIYFFLFFQLLLGFDSFLLITLPYPSLTKIICFLSLLILVIQTSLGKKSTFLAWPVIKLTCSIIPFLDFIGIDIVDCRQFTGTNIASRNEANSSSTQSRDISGRWGSKVRLFRGPSIAHCSYKLKWILFNAYFILIKRWKTLANEH